MQFYWKCSRVRERIGERPYGSEAMHGRGDAESASGKVSAVSGRFIIHIGTAINIITILQI